jgi:Putative Ig domain/Domain of unknown function (DUF222)
VVAAAGGGATLADLAGLAQEIFERSQHHGREDNGDSFDERGVWLDVTFAGDGRLNGDLSAGCSAALSAVLQALGKKAGPEDSRTAAQRRHDALAEACRRLIAAGMVPGRAGQPTQILVHMGLGQLRGASGAEAAWRAAAAQHGWLAGAEAEAAACDATIVPIVTGHPDPAALGQLAEAFLSGPQARGAPPPGSGGRAEPVPSGPGTCGCTCGGCTCPTRTPLSPRTRGRLRSALLALAADALSGPGGLAAHLRAGLGSGPLASVSLPLDVGAAFTWTILPPTVTCTNPGDPGGTVGVAISPLQITCTDSAGEALTYSGTLPPGLAIDPATGLITGTLTTAGTYGATVTATDTSGSTGSCSFTWTVNTSTTPPPTP